MSYITKREWGHVSAKSTLDRHKPALFVGDDAGDAEVLEKGLVFTAAVVTPI